MICKIAELIAEVPETDGLPQRCRNYLYNGSDSRDVIIRTENYRTEKRDPRMRDESFAYMESAYQFYVKLVEFGGFYLHASAVVLDGKAYLFSGRSGAGKSTHTRLWQQLFGPAARVINDDKPALRLIDGEWYAYGTPWCGKDGINLNERAPIAGVCFLKKAQCNRIRHMEQKEAIARILGQTIYKFDNQWHLDLLLSSLECFLKDIPVYELENLPEISAAQLSYETMRHGIQGLEHENQG